MNERGRAWEGPALFRFSCYMSLGDLPDGLHLAGHKGATVEGRFATVADLECAQGHFHVVSLELGVGGDPHHHHAAVELPDGDRVVANGRDGALNLRACA